MPPQPVLLSKAPPRTIDLPSLPSTSDELLVNTMYCLNSPMLEQVPLPTKLSEHVQFTYLCKSHIKLLLATPIVYRVKAKRFTVEEYL